MSKIKRKFLIVATEVLVPMFLLYVNVFMGYFTMSGKSKGLALQEIVKDMATPEMFFISLVGGLVAFLTLEFLREKIKQS